MTKELSITDNKVNDSQSGGDLFGKDSIILIRLNKLPKDYKETNLIDSTECTIVEEFLVKNRKEVFDSIYNTGKTIYKSLKEDTFNILFNCFMDGYPSGDTQNLFKETATKYIQENGYPYLVEQLPHLPDKLGIPNYYEFINDCVTIYIIEELSKWVHKILQNKNQGRINKSNGVSFDTTPTYKIRSLFNIFKSRLISIMTITTNVLFNDDISQEEVLKVLNHGLPIDNTNEKLSQEEIDYRNKFLKILQRSLIYYVIAITNGPYRLQYIVTKQLPVYNKTSQQYRLYTMAHSLMGIAYDHLLLNLTATKYNYERAICAIPSCNNEFEKIGKTIFCSEHEEWEIKRYINQKYYASKKNNKSKKA